LEVGSLERHCAIEHSVKNDSSTPNIASIALITLVFEYFWCYISRCSALFSHLDIRSDELRNAEITDFDITL
jgi:hypothetical protein